MAVGQCFNFPWGNVYSTLTQPFMFLPPQVKTFVLETIASDPGLQQTELVFLGLFGRACRVLESGAAAEVCPRHALQQTSHARGTGALPCGAGHATVTADYLCKGDTLRCFHPLLNLHPHRQTPRPTPFCPPSGPCLPRRSWPRLAPRRGPW